MLLFVLGGPAHSPKRPVAASKQDCARDPLGALQLDAAVYCSPGRRGREQGVVPDGRRQNTFYHVLFRVVVRPRPPARLRGGLCQGGARVVPGWCQGTQLSTLTDSSASSERSRMGWRRGGEEEETWGQEVRNARPRQLSLGRGG